MRLSPHWSRNPRVGAMLLMGTGVVNFGLSLWLSRLVGSEKAFNQLLAYLLAHWGETETIHRGAQIQFFFGDILPLLVILMLGVALIQIAAGIVGYAGRGFYVVVAAGLMGLVTIITIPLALGSLVITFRSHSQYL